MAVKMVSVESSNLKSVGYDEKNSQLYIDFKKAGGGKSSYVYYNVPKDIYDELLEADSKGQYLFNNIKGVYNYKKIS